MSIQFSNAVNESAVAMSVLNTTSIQTVTISSFLNSNLVETFNPTISNINSNNFYGFTGSLFDEIRIEFGPDINAVALDNIQTGSVVPEPSSLVLVGIGAIVLFGYGWRRKRKLGG